MLSLMPPTGSVQVLLNDIEILRNANGGFKEVIAVDDVIRSATICRNRILAFAAIIEDEMESKWMHF